MIEWISSWAEQVIVAVIIGTIIEMILPNGNNKKYVKTIIGIYIVFIIVSPIISKIVNIDFDNFNYEKYFEDSDTYQTMSSSLTDKNDKSIEEIYIQNIKQDMKSKLKERGYILNSVEIEMESSEENYGKINKIVAYISKENEKDTENNNVSINKVETINIGSTDSNTLTEKEFDNNIKISEIKEIKEYLSSVYEINKKNIQINDK